MLTQERLKEVLKYDPKTGNFIRKVNRGGQKAGNVAGSHHPRGYTVIYVDSEQYKAHRLAWLYLYGYLPSEGIDHINRNKTDNRASNLRVVSQLCNCRNANQRSDNKSGVSGVHWDGRSLKWKTQINLMGKRYGVGTFTDFDEAVCHRLAAEQCLDWLGCSTTSDAYQHVKNNIQHKERRIS